MRLGLPPAPMADRIIRLALADRRHSNHSIHSSESSPLLSYCAESPLSILTEDYYSRPEFLSTNHPSCGKRKWANGFYVLFCISLSSSRFIYSSSLLYYYYYHSFYFNGIQKLGGQSQRELLRHGRASNPIGSDAGQSRTLCWMSCWFKYKYTGLTRQHEPAVTSTHCCNPKRF